MSENPKGCSKKSDKEKHREEVYAFLHFCMCSFRRADIVWKQRNAGGTSLPAKNYAKLFVPAATLPNRHIVERSQ